MLGPCKSTVLDTPHAQLHELTGYDASMANWRITVHVIVLGTGSLLDDSHPEIDLDQIRNQAFDKVASSL